MTTFVPWLASSFKSEAIKKVLPLPNDPCKYKPFRL